MNVLGGLVFSCGLGRGLYTMPAVQGICYGMIRDGRLIMPQPLFFHR
jgi:hypothetical protein